MEKQKTKQEPKLKQKITVPQLAVSKRFGRYKKEEKKEEREATIKRSKRSVELEKAFAEFCTYSNEKLGYGNYDMDEARYAKALEIIKKLEYSQEDIEMFLIRLMEIKSKLINLRGYDFSNGKPGFFLSALINSGIEDNYRIVTTHLDFEIRFLGYRNTKNIEIQGNAGNYFGARMLNGKIVIAGSVSFGWEMSGGMISITGDTKLAGVGMKGGIISVTGNVIDVGRDMVGGKIFIEGNASICQSMRGGEIHVNGKISFGSLSCNPDLNAKIINGKIFHRGELIVNK